MASEVFKVYQSNTKDPVGGDCVYVVAGPWLGSSVKSETLCIPSSNETHDKYLSQPNLSGPVNINDFL